MVCVPGSTGTAGETIGVDMTNRLPVMYQTLDDVTVLRSVARDTSRDMNLPPRARGLGGGVQYYMPDNSKVLGGQ